VSVQLRIPPRTSATRFVFNGKEEIRSRNKRRDNPVARYLRRSLDGNVEFPT